MGGELLVILNRKEGDILLGFHARNAKAYWARVTIFLDILCFIPGIGVRNMISNIGLILCYTPIVSIQLFLY